MTFKNNTYIHLLYRFRNLILLILFCTVAFTAFNTDLKLVFYEIKTDKIDKNLRIALLTDLHACRYGDKQSELIASINSLKPDVVLLGGDIADDEIPNDNVEHLLKGLNGKYPMYYVTGNHEYWSNDVDGILKLFKSYDVKILEGNYETINLKGQSLTIGGVSDPDITVYTDSKFDMQMQMNALKPASRSGNYNILLAHRPELYETYLSADFDLILSGHAHGGQWRVPGLVNGLYAPNQGWFPKYAGGQYTFDHTTMIVSRGLARESTRIPRIFNRPELVIVDLLPSVIS